MPASMMTTKDLDSQLVRLKAEGCKIERDRSAGTCKAYDPISKEVVLQAIQKGKNQPWIVRMMDTQMIQWHKIPKIRSDRNAAE